MLQAFLLNGHFRPELMAGFDLNHDGKLDIHELRVDSESKRKLAEHLLVAAGISNPVIRTEVRMHRVSHGVAGRNQTLSDCTACHGSQSRLKNSILLSSWIPAAALPSWKNSVVLSDAMKSEPDGKLIWTPDSSVLQSLHVFGLSGNDWPDQMGLILFIAVVLAVAIHAGYRMTSRNQRQQYSTAMRKEYLFTAYERIWHWVMALSVVGLIFTGWQIHFPGVIRLLNATLLVATHNFFAAVLALNAFLALFYHLATAAIRQFLPSRQGVSEAVTLQTKYYLRDIFKGLPSPFPRSPERKLNVLQQFTYLFLLNLLFPFQILTGIAIWGVGMSPPFAAWIGGLRILAPLHNLGSWMFLSFLVAHLYLATTERTIFAHLWGMIEGYEEVEEGVFVEGEKV